MSEGLEVEFIPEEKFICSSCGATLTRVPPLELQMRYDNLRARLSEAQGEIERLKEHACEYSIDDKVITNPCGYVMRLLDRAEKSEAEIERLKEQLRLTNIDWQNEVTENAALKARLKSVEDIFIKYGNNIDYIINHSLGINKELWQTIKVVCEGNNEI